MNVKIYPIIILLFNSFVSFSQIKTDATSIFKMQLFLDNKNLILTGLDTAIIRDDSLYNSFSDVVNLKLDTLEIKGNYYLTKSSLSPKYKFFQLKEHSYRKALNELEMHLYRVFGDTFCSIAINQETGKCYRLLGFNTNDFLSFLADFREEYREKQEKKLGVSYFLKNYSVNNIDFYCLNKGLKRHKVDRKKYPCLVRASDPIWVE